MKEKCPLLPFDPYYVDEFAYTEGNAWQWKFQPMHDFNRLKQEIYQADLAQGKDTTPEKAFREDLTSYSMRVLQTQAKSYQT